jgi:hypothetical protein
MKPTHHVCAADNYGMCGKTLVNKIQQSQPPSKRIVRTLAAGASAVALLSTAHADEITPTVMSPPVHTELRYDEDYSYLKDPAARTNLFDPLKFIPLDERGDMYLTLGGQVRDRYENFQNYTFGSGPQTPGGYNLLRGMADADLHLGQYVRAFVEGLSATEQGRAGGPRPSDVNDAALYQAFLDLNVPIGSDASLTLRGGRQVIIFGAQRLIGVSDFTDVRRTDDALRATLRTPGNTLDVFYARPVRVRPYDFDDDAPPDNYFAGIYDTWEVSGDWAKAMNTKLEMYSLYNNRPSMTFNTTTAGEDRYTLGTRLTTNPKPFDFDLEPDYQFGRFHGEATHSFSVAAVGGYTLEQAMFAPRAFVGFDIASGGSHGRAGDAFDQLFPSAHDQFGIMDVLGRQNIIDVHPGATWELLQQKAGGQRLTLLTQYRQFWRESDQDAAYASTGSILRTSSGSDARALGGEVDAQLSWQINRYLGAYAGFCHFFHGEFIAETGSHKDIDFAYSAVTFTF